MSTSTDKGNEKDKDEEKSGFIWYSEILNLSEDAVESVNQICNDWSDYVGAMADEDVGARDESRSSRYQYNARISSELKELKSVTSKIHERLGNIENQTGIIEAQTRQPTFWENLKKLIFENTVSFFVTILMVLIIGYLGLNWLLG